MWNPSLPRRQTLTLAAVMVVLSGIALYLYLMTPARSSRGLSTTPARLYHNTVISQIQVTHKPLVSQPSLLGKDGKPKGSARGFGLPLSKGNQERRAAFETLVALEQRDANFVEGILRSKGVPLELTAEPAATESPIRLQLHLTVGGRESIRIENHPTYGLVRCSLTLRRELHTADGVLWAELIDPEQSPPLAGLPVCTPEAFGEQCDTLLRRAALDLAERWHRENPGK
jgi:hypothetical protein